MRSLSTFIAASLGGMRRADPLSIAQATHNARQN